MPPESTPSVRFPSGSVRFSLAANYDLELVSALAAYPVDEVYGKFPADGVSGGRPRYLATPLSESDLRQYIQQLDRHGMAFNYLLNGACFG
ncbi:MAG: peptidase U32, partial [Opitutae bacterium]|nr:peptidase U32 [Opitutae bacterium]